MRLILPISFIIVTVSLFIAVINPFYKDVQEIKGELSSYKIALDNSAEFKKLQYDLVEKYKNIRSEDKERLMHLLPSTINNIELILEVERIANLHGFPVKDTKFDATKKDKNEEKDNKNNVSAEVDPKDRLPYGIFPMEFIIEGKYDAFVDFLKDLELNLRLVDIKSVSFTVPVAGVGEKIDPNIYTYTLRAEIYWLK